MYNPSDEQTFDLLIEYLGRSHDFDFSGYRRTTLARRIQRRMQTNKVETFADYMDYLENHPEEYVQMFNTVLINVTGFFRDPVSWEVVAGEVLPTIIANKEPSEPIRVWTAGCASGEEVYTIAILLAETLGSEKFREQVRIYGTDIDEEALYQARQATYTLHQLRGAPAPLVSKYFEEVNGRYSFRKELQLAIVFGRNDLLHDAPIPHIDLLTCRNTLMYFTAEAQSQILQRFHFALENTGVLFLGKAEQLFTRSRPFVAVNLKQHIYAKAPALSRSREAVQVLIPLINRESTTNPLDDLRGAAYAAGPIAQIIIGFDGQMLLANDPAKTLLGIATTDIGRFLRDLELSRRIVVLRPGIEQAYIERRSVKLDTAGESEFPETMKLIQAPKQQKGRYEFGPADDRPTNR